MTDKLLPSEEQKDFEAQKLTNEHGAKYWSNCDLEKLLGYGQRRRFQDAIKRAITSCEFQVMTHIITLPAFANRSSVANAINVIFNCQLIYSSLSRLR